VRHASDDELWNWLPEEARSFVPKEKRELFLELVRWNCLFPEEGRTWAEILWREKLPLSEKAQEVIEEAGQAFFQTVLEAFSEEYETLISRLKKRTGRKGRKLFMPLRAALTGRLDGPELELLWKLLPPETKRKRLERYA